MGPPLESNAPHRPNARMEMNPALALDPDACCSSTSWLGAFAGHTLRAELIDLPRAFLEFLVEDGVYVGDGTRAVSRGA
jgi:hypothetical protein